MSRWVRWYEGTCEDGKFRVVARMSRVTLRDVLALWAFILEDAGDLEHRGICQRNEDYMAAILDFELDEVNRILEAMEDADLISVGHGEITVCNFKKRQFDSDTDPTASRRKREQRERDAIARHSDVTRDTGGSDNRIQNTEKKVTEADASGAAAPVYTDSKHELWGEGIPILESLGVKGARSIVGRWMRDTKDDAQRVLGAIQRARDARVTDPIPWITRALSIEGNRAAGAPRAKASRSVQDVARELLAEFRGEAPEPPPPMRVVGSG